MTLLNGALRKGHDLCPFFLLSVTVKLNLPPPLTFSFHVVSLQLRGTGWWRENRIPGRIPWQKNDTSPPVLVRRQGYACVFFHRGPVTPNDWPLHLTMWETWFKPRVPREPAFQPEDRSKRSATQEFCRQRRRTTLFVLVSGGTYWTFLAPCNL